MQSPKGGTTAAELIERLGADSDYQARMEERRQEVERLTKERRREQAPLLRELAAIGIEIDDVWQLTQGKPVDASALPTLLAHIALSYEPHTLLGIRMALARGAGAGQEARSLVWQALVAMLRADAMPLDPASAVLGTVAELARPADTPLLIELISNQELGRGRILLVRNLMRSRKPEARAALLALEHDPDLHIEIAARLKASGRSRPETHALL